MCWNTSALGYENNSFFAYQNTINLLSHKMLGGDLMLEYHKISKDAFAKLYCDYVCNYIKGRETANPLVENLVLVNGNNVVNDNGDVIGRIVD